VRITVCDQCDKRVKSHKHDRFDDDATIDWLSVEANWDVDHGQFCSWPCLAEWAMSKAIEHEGRTEDEVHEHA
jgi:hypothetical protein